MDYGQMMQKVKTDFQVATANSVWKTYQDVVMGMSVEQRNWVQKQETVINAKQEMFAIFLDYLFENNRDAFVNAYDGKYKSIVDNYIDTIRKAADSYVSRAEVLEKENAELREKIKEFLSKEQKHDTMATVGTRQGRESSFDEVIRTRNNSEPSGNNLELFENQS